MVAMKVDLKVALDWMTAVQKEHLMVDQMVLLTAVLWVASKDSMMVVMLVASKVSMMVVLSVPRKVVLMVDPKVALLVLMMAGNLVAS